jgi:hypothetical protein
MDTQDKQEQLQEVIVEEKKSENVVIHVTGWTLFSDFKL